MSLLPMQNLLGNDFMAPSKVSFLYCTLSWMPHQSIARQQLSIHLNIRESKMCNDWIMSLCINNNFIYLLLNYSFFSACSKIEKYILSLFIIPFCPVRLWHTYVSNWDTTIIPKFPNVFSPLHSHHVGAMLGLVRCMSFFHNVYKHCGPVELLKRALFVWASWIVYGIGLTNGLSFGWDSVFGGVFVKLNEFFSLVMLVAQKYFTWETFSFTELGLFPHIFSFYMELNVVL